MPTLTYFTHNVIVAYLSGEAITPLTEVYVGVLTQEPSPDGSNVVEPSGGYLRQAITFTAPSIVNNMTYFSNDTKIMFPTATLDWAQVTHMGIFDGDDNLLVYGPLAAPRTIPTDDVLAFAIGSIQIRLN